MSKRLFALVIGVNQYQSNEIINPEGCVRDAQAIQDALLEHSKDAEIISLIDAAATRAEILRAFKEQLINNSNIMRDDPIVVYFACKGCRLDTPDGAPFLDVLLPHDHCNEVPGISESSVHALLCELSQKKGANITLILDTSFCNMVPRVAGGPLGHRSELLSYSTFDSPEYTGFFADAGSSYVVLAACEKEQLAYESSDGGVFTQGLMSLMRQNPLATYRELARSATFFRQDAVCSGFHADRLLFSAPSYAQFPKLRVFLEQSFALQLQVKQEDDFVQVGDKESANIALRSAPEREIVIERLDGIVAKFASRNITVVTEDPESLTRILNDISHFDYYLSLETPRPSLSPWTKFVQSLALATTKPTLQVFSFTGVHLEAGVRSKNLLSKGIVHLSSTPPDCYYAFSITNRSKERVYPYLLALDPSDYRIEVFHPSEGVRGVKPLEPHRLLFSSSLTVGDGTVPRRRFLKFHVNPSSEDKDAAFFKLILCRKALDLCHLEQKSVNLVDSSRDQILRPAQHQICTPTIPGIQDTALAILYAQLAPQPSKALWQSIFHRKRTKS
ncbi:hypothetical protein C8R43DRAFT_167453 [Mycena crocata]|nr:hypothetical protein C8R43DRAFT_167453 [Mycena crocata]